MDCNSVGRTEMMLTGKQLQFSWTEMIALMLTGGKQLDEIKQQSPIVTGIQRTRQLLVSRDEFLDGRTTQSRYLWWNL
jgi:hypothetical protein